MPPAQDSQWREWKADTPATPAPGAASLIQTLVGHCTPWRGGASPGGGSGRRLGRAWLSLSRVPQGTPAHLPGSRTPALPAPSVLRHSPHPTVPALGSPHTRASPRSAPSRGATHLAVPPERSHPHSPWACQPRVGDSGVPRGAAAWGPGSPAAQVWFSRAATSALEAAEPRDSSGPPPSMRRPVPRRDPTCQSIPRARLKSCLPGPGGN